MRHKFIAWLLMIFIVSSMAFAIGVSPVRKVIDFEPNKEVELDLLIRNDAGFDIKALVYARGELAEYIGIKDSLMTVTKEESQKKARYVMKMPAAFEKPGVHKTDLVVVEYPSSFGQEGETAVTATASVVTELWVRVPFPGKYAEADLTIDSKEDKVDFYINVLNFGKDDIKEAKATIKILGATYEEIAAVETQTISIKAQDQAQLITSWIPNVNPGRYHAIAEIEYDGKKIILEKNFEVGKLYIEIKRIDVKDFNLGDVAVFDILLLSHWNEMIPDVYGEMTVLDADGTEYTKFKTASVDVAAQEEATLKAFWDTEGITVGTYTLRLLIHYAQRVTEKLIDTEVNIDSITTELGPTAQVVAEEGIDRDTVLTVLVIILVIINIVWFVYFMKSKKKGKKK
ncbi:hypothetical protein GOV09_05740 [Candidatus Woesearchaeota archaeon]|nr:hypothetical protein [Candidatus Woesearchaeota archaeon]